MALFEYQFEISSDFVNQKVNITILQTEIEASTIITTELHHITANIDEDTCIVHFNDELSSAEEDELQAIIAAHTGEYAGGVNPGDVPEGGGPSDIVFVYGDQYDDYYIYFKHDSYKVGTQFIFRGTNSIGTPVGVKAILNGDGKLRLFDKTHNEVLFEWDNIQQEDWDIFSYADINWPTEESILELQGRELSESNHNLYCSCFMICFIGEITNNFPSGGPV